MAAGAITNALFDAWSRQQELPLWKALSRLEPEQIVAMLDFRYVEHLLTADEALSILRASAPGREARIAEMGERGLPCYHTTWIGSGTDELLAQIESVRAERGITTFKVKVGGDIAHDHERLSAIRERFGETVNLFVDANQVWSVPEAIEWMRALAEFRIGWIEEPTAPDLIDGHRAIREALAPLGMGPPENILIMLVAAKYGVPICPHAGGSGLDELVPHLAAFNYVCCAPTLERVIVEQVGFCADYFIAPSSVRDGRVSAPDSAGYIVGMRPDALAAHAYPDGSAWRARP